MKRFVFGLLLVLLLTACPPTNQAPSITAPDDQENTVGDTVNLSISATDPEDDPLEFSAAGLPTGLSISQAGSVTGSPTEAKTFDVTVTVDDGNGNTPSVSFSWHINPKPNVAPIIDAVSDQENTVGDAVDLSITATDPEGDALMFTASGLPTGLSMSTDGNITGSPNTEGSFDVSVTVDDGNGNTPSISFMWLINAAPVNQAPSITQPDDQENRIGDDVSLSIVATDPEGDDLSFSATGLPDGLEISDNGDITGSPITEGSFDVVVTVDDGNGNAPTTDFTWLIKPALLPEPPAFTLATAYSASEPKLMVSISDLETDGLETLEYRLERFSDQCSDAANVKTGMVTTDSSNVSFDIPTTNYGAFKLSVTSSYSTDIYENPTRTVFAPLSLPANADPPTGIDTEGLVYVELIDDYNGAAQQINEDFGNSLPVQVSFDLQADDTLLGVLYDVSGLGSSNRLWCGALGDENIVAPGSTELISAEPTESEFDGDGNPLEPFFFQAQPIEGVVEKRLYVLYEVIVYQVIEAKTIDDVDEVEEIARLEYVVMDCSSDEFPSGLSCEDYNDFPR